MTAPTLDLTVDLTSPLPQQRGLRELAEQVRRTRPSEQPPAPQRPLDAMAALFEAELRQALQAGDAARATEAAAALWRRTGDLTRGHAALARVLADVGAAWAAGAGSVRDEHRCTAAATAVIGRLRAATPAAPPSPLGPVLLATPPGERHVLALDALAHVLEAAGHPVDVLGDLPAGELVRAAAGARAVVLSVHRRDPSLPGLLSRLRAAAPQALLVVGGPAARGCTGADLLTSDTGALLAALERPGCPLSERERQVLQLVADGLTNAEAAAELGIAPATLKTHLDRVFERTGTSRRSAAVAVAVRRGWI